MTASYTPSKRRPSASTSGWRAPWRKCSKYAAVVPSTAKPRWLSPSDSGTTQATARCRATASRLLVRMLFVAPPMRNTAYSSSCTGPVRAPTTRSVPETACAKLVRTSWRRRSSPSSRKLDSAIVSATRPST